MCFFCNLCRKKNPYTPDLTNKVYVLTGGTKGIGRECLFKLAQLSATIIFTGRTRWLGLELQETIQLQYPSAKIKYIQVDHKSFASIKKFSEYLMAEYKNLDCLINNIGGFTDKSHTDDGFSYQIQLNYYSMFY